MITYCLNTTLGGSKNKENNNENTIRELSQKEIDLQKDFLSKKSPKKFISDFPKDNCHTSEKVSLLVYGV